MPGPGKSYGQTVGAACVSVIKMDAKRPAAEPSQSF
jgi:hypothetical protein